jgi:hypothetical protein
MEGRPCLTRLRLPILLLVLLLVLPPGHRPILLPGHLSSRLPVRLTGRLPVCLLVLLSMSLMPRGWFSAIGFRSPWPMPSC